MAISLADTSGPFLDRLLPMPDTKKPASGKLNFLHRLSLRKWLARESFRHLNSSFSKPVASRPLPLSLPATPVPPPITPPRPLTRSSYDNGDFDSDRADKHDLSPPQRRSASTVDLSLPRETPLDPNTPKNEEILASDENTQTAARPASPGEHNRPTSPHKGDSAPDPPEPQPSTPNEQPEDGALQDNPTNNEKEEPVAPPNEISDSIARHGEEFEKVIILELDRKWILNLSMRFRDPTDSEKFFVTYAESPSFWRKVTVTCNYENIEQECLERDLKGLRFQRDKNLRIYEALRESMDEIQFFDTVTNLKLETEQGRLHVHVSEDVNEIITYPSVSTVAHLNPPFIPESLLTFHSHLSGFVYHVKLNGEDYVKKEITGPDTVEEFLYEVNALHALIESDCVIKFKGILVDDSVTLVKGLLLEYASLGSLADIFFDYKGAVTWGRRERWARQIIRGLADIHEAGFVQGDFTVSNVVVDKHDDAKIIDINRRGCPIGWEPPEFTKKIESKQKISMYIGVKSDLFQLGMTLWAMAMEDDEPGLQPRPLIIPADADVPGYFRNVVQICLHPSPQRRLSAKELLVLFPPDHLAEKLLEYPKQDSGNFTATQRYDFVDPDFRYNSHQQDFEAQRADSIYIDSLPNSNLSMDRDTQSHVARPSLSSLHPISHDSDTRDIEIESDFYQSDFLPSSPDDPYCLDDISPSAALPGVHPFLEQLTQYGLGLANPGDSIQYQPPLSTTSYSVNPNIPVDPLEPEDHRGYPGRALHNVEDIPEALACIGDHMFLPSAVPYISNTGLALETDILSRNFNDEETSNAEDYSGHSSGERSHEAAQQALREPDPNDLIQSRLPINPAFVECSTSVPINRSSSATRLASSSGDESRLPTAQTHAPLTVNDFSESSQAALSIAERHFEPIPPGYDSLLPSQLEFNTPSLSTLRSLAINQQPDNSSSLCINLESELSSPSVLSSDDLFTSNLPINPAYSP
ncbi:hypothetical protein LOZ39_003196 [Ophidiomyces ophidiicola]|nr:hypothetical protein LOZ61_002316 [Ophidiomyces ophidiicola]KAI1915830.1 hypothetical protein LOZ64_003470 [Ophidiomyces ophidiicola]KAI1926612.1 hypothetical protein LOZ60_003536 [Ophidiomyces ophidiicola]KAI1963724.1 hypothetical protein LOZ59_001647 [Ophidiomyces ophidiicola]KAI2013056.1 hypothetical protein LOZ49_002419 [Ophidiomyces ophidiicola]